MRPFLVILALVLLVTPAFAVLETSDLKVFAVAPDGTALSATLGLQLRPGSGEVWSSVSGPLVGTATQSTEKIAVKVAENYSNDVDNYDFFFSIDSEASVVDGPSAGSAMALLVVSALEGRDIPSNVGLTGTITNNGQVGPVGGVFEKAKEASKNGIKLFMIPKGESRQVVKFPSGVENVNLPEYAIENWGMKIVETGTLDDVLKYAFMDIASIDINSEEDPDTPTFIPPKITPNLNQEPLKQINTEIIAQSRKVIEDARTALNQTLLDDPGLIEVLSRSLSDSEKTVNEAELLSQNGYYYSAGNFAFLAKVNANFVLDVSQNPDLMDLESGKLKDWASALQKRITAEQKILDQTVPIEGVEWYIAAQQRLTWAQQKVDQLLNSPVIVVVTPDAVQAEAVQRIQDYEYASGWMDSTVIFYQVALQKSTKGLKDQAPFRDYYSEYVENAQNGLTIVSPGSGEDAQRRLDAALIDQNAGRHLSAAMNAASSLALINANLVESDPDNDVEDMLSDKIDELEQKMAENPQRYAWGRLYLDHAKFYLNSAEYYKEINQGSLAAGSVSSGYTLVLLAENTYEVTKDFQDYYDKLPAGAFTTLTPVSGNGNVIPISIGSDGKGSITINAQNNEIPLNGILVAIIIVLAVLYGLSHISHRAQKLPQTIANEELKAKDGGSQTLYRVDELEARLFAARQGLRHAQFQHQTGKLSDESYKEVSEHYTEQMRGLSKQLRGANSELRSAGKQKEVKAPAKAEKKWPKEKTVAKKTKKK